jgi:hypothetical protein
MSKSLAAALMLLIVLGTMAQSQNTFAFRIWPLEKSQPLIDKTQTIRLAPDLSKLTDGEKKAVEKLLAVGQIFQKLYEEKRHLRH